MLKHLFTSVLFVITCFSFTSVLAQKAITKANSFYDRNLFKEAIPLYKEELENSNSEAKDEASEKLAHCYRLTGNFEEAEKLYKKLLAKNKKDANYQLYYALSLKASSKYSEASEEFNKYIALKPNDPMGKVYLESCSLAQIWLDEKIGAEVRHLDLFNTENSEFGTFFYKEGVVFCSSRKDSKTPLINFEGGEIEPKLDFYFVNTRKPFDSLVIEKFDHDNINSPMHEGPACFSITGDTIYFTRTLKGIKDRAKNIRINTLQVLMSYKTLKGWSDPKPAFRFDSKKYSVAHPSLSPDGKTMFFSSDMPGGMGGMDLYYSRREGDGTWSTPVNLGPQVNTFGNELYPYIYDNSTLYFSSDALPGMGKLDIFKCVLINGVWQQAENIKPPFNSIGDDFAFIIDRKTRQGFFSSDRFDSKGLDDIYAFSDFDPTHLYLDGDKIKIADNTIFDGFKYKIVNNETKQDTNMVSKGGYFEFIPDTAHTYTISIRKEGFSYNKIDIEIDRNTEKDYLLAAIKSKQKTIRVSGTLLEPNYTDTLNKEKAIISEIVTLSEKGNILEEQVTNKFGQFDIDGSLKNGTKYLLEAKRGAKAETFTLSGQILSEGATLQGASVSLVKNGKVIAETKTNELGFYNFDGLTPGNEYLVSVANEGYEHTIKEISDMDFATASNKKLFKTIEVKATNVSSDNTDPNTLLSENSITNTPKNSFELIAKITNKGQLQKDTKIKIYEDGKLLTEMPTNNNGMIGLKHLDKTKSYTIVAVDENGKENIYALDKNEYSNPGVITLAKQIDFTGGKYNKTLDKKDLAKLNKEQLFNRTDSLYASSHLKSIKGKLTELNKPLENATVKILENGVLIDKIKTDADGNYYFDRLNSKNNYELVVERKGVDEAKIEIYKEDITENKTSELTRNIDLDHGATVNSGNKAGPAKSMANLQINLTKDNTALSNAQVKIFENGHEMLETHTDKEGYVLIKNLDPMKKYSMVVSQKGKQIYNAALPVASNFYAQGDTLNIQDNLSKQGLRDIVPHNLNIPNKVLSGKIILQEKGPLKGSLINMFEDGKLVESVKTDESGKFKFEHFNANKINSLEIEKPDGTKFVYHLTEKDYKAIASGQFTIDPELTKLEQSENTAGTTNSTLATFTNNGTPLASQSFQLMENNNMLTTLTTNPEGKTILPFLDPTKKYSLKTNVNGKEILIPFDRNNYYLSKNKEYDLGKYGLPGGGNQNEQVNTTLSADIEGKLGINGKPLGSTELKLYENGQLKEVIKTDNEGHYLLSKLDPSKVYKLTCTSNGKPYEIKVDNKLIGLAATGKVQARNLYNDLNKSTTLSELSIGAKPEAENNNEIASLTIQLLNNGQKFISEDIQFLENGTLKDFEGTDANGILDLEKLELTKSYSIKLKVNGQTKEITIDPKTLKNQFNLTTDLPLQLELADANPLLKANGNNSANNGNPVISSTTNNVSLTANNAPLVNQEIKVYENGQLKSVLNTNNKGDVSLGTLNTKNKYTLKTTDEQGKELSLNISTEELNKMQTGKPTLNFSNNTNISANNSAQLSSGSSNFLGKVTNNNLPLANEKLRIYENGKLVKEITTDNNGVFEISGLNPNNIYTVKPGNSDDKQFQLNANEMSVSRPVNTSNIELSKNNASANFAPANLSSLKTNTLKANLNYNRTTISNRDLQLIENGKPKSTITTDAAGNMIAEGINPGAVYTLKGKDNAGNPYEYTLNTQDFNTALTSQVSINVASSQNNVSSATSNNNPQSTTPTANTSTGNFVYLGKINSNNLPYSNQPIKIFEDGKLIKEVTTNTKGEFDLNGLNSNATYTVKPANNENKHFQLNGSAITVKTSASRQATELSSLPVPLDVFESGLSDKLYKNSTIKGKLTEGNTLQINKDIQVVKNGAVVETVTTDGKGNFVISAIDPAANYELKTKSTSGKEYMVKLSNEDLSKGMVKPITINLNKQTPLAEPVDNDYSVYKGIVKNNGSTFANQTLKLYENGEYIKDVKTDANGNFETNGLTKGNTYTAKPQADESKQFSLNTAAISNNKNAVVQTTELSNSGTANDLFGNNFPTSNLKQAVYKGKFTENGAPIRSKDIEVYQNGTPKQLITTDNQGNFIAQNLNPNSTYDFKVKTNSGKEYVYKATPAELQTGLTQQVVTDLAEMEKKLASATTNGTNTPAVALSSSYNPQALLKGKVHSNNVGLPATTVKLYENGKLIEEKSTDSKGNFSFDKAQKNGNYKVEISKPEYSPASYNVSSSEMQLAGSNTSKSTELIPENFIYLKGKVENKGKGVANAPVSLSKDNKIIGQTTADKDGNYQFYAAPEKQYIARAASKDFFNGETNINTQNQKPGATLTQNVVMRDLEVNESVRLNNIYYDFGKADIRFESVPELEKLVEFMNLNPSVEIEISAYTDSRGDDAYNQKLSEDRAHNVQLFLMLEGIEKRRIIYKGYGESAPIIPDATSEEDHQLNRRTEFKVIKK